MVEVFKTNVGNCDEAGIVLDHIRLAFVDYEANFDLEDCDRVLRIKCVNSDISSEEIIQLLSHLGFEAVVLPEIVYS